LTNLDSRPRKGCRPRRLTGSAGPCHCRLTVALSRFMDG